uniref:Syntaxin-binding protein 6 n=1 Tax=Esox lucius TaxID=8010 RepID=A0AAY5KN45_ESOLU
MSAKAAINKEVFTPHDEKMLAAVQVKRRTKKKIPFLATGGQGDYMTFICLSEIETHQTRQHSSSLQLSNFGAVRPLDCVQATE